MSLWRRFRGLPLWGQVLLWIFLWPFVAALFFWQWEEADPHGKVAALLVVALPFAIAGLAGGADAPSTIATVPTPTAEESEEPEESPTLTATTPSLLPTASPTEASPSPTIKPTITPSSGTQRALVERVVDGDTIWVRVDEPGGRLPANASHQIRILEIDTPETVHPSKPVECWGPEASAFAKSELPVGSTVELLHDEEDRDRFGRYLRYVWDFEREFFNYKAVVLGHARAVLFMPNDLYWPTIEPAEDEARAADRGLWGPPCNGSA